jgi:hypothetical protein
MPEEPTLNDPYDAVLSDMRARRDQLDQMITSLESLRAQIASGGMPAPAGTPKPDAINTSTGPGSLLGMSIVDAAKKLLGQKRQPLRNPEFAVLFKAGGLVLNSREPANTIGSVLTRRFAEHGDVVRVERGTWGLKEWYPNRSFKKDKSEGEDKSEAKTESSATVSSSGQPKPKFAPPKRGVAPVPSES